MSDDQIINLIWGVMELEQKFEDDPYSLSLEEIDILKDNEKNRIR
jgi:hypothetical protein